MTIFDFISKITTFIPIATFILKIIRSIFFTKKCSPKYTMLCKEPITKDTSSINGLLIEYKGTKVEQLTINTFVFWNSGEIGLKSEAYGIVCPYIGCSEKAKILGYEIRCEHLHQHINLNVVLSDNKLSFTFDEIVRNQGFVIDIIHTGRNKDLFFSANFKNAKIKRKFICHKLHKSLLDKIPCSILWISWLLVVTIAALSNIITESLSIKSIVYGIISFSLTLIGLLTHFRENYAPYWGVPLNLQASIKEFDK